MRRAWLRAYIALNGALALAAIALPLWHPPRPTDWAWWGAAALCLAAVLTDVWEVRMAVNRTTSVATIPHLAAALLLPPPVAAAVAGLAVLAVQALRRRPMERILFNTGNTTATVGATAWLADAFGLVGGNVGQAGATQVLQFIALATAYQVANNVSVAGAISLSTGKRVSQVVLDSMRLSAPAKFTVGVIGGLAAFVWVANPYWLLLVLFPAVISQFTLSYIASISRKATQLAALDALGRAVSATLTPGKTFEVLRRELSDQHKVDGAFLWLADGAVDLADAAAGDESTAPLRKHLVARVLAEGKPIQVQHDGPAGTGSETTGRTTWLAVPLRVGQTVQGCLGVVAADAHRLDTDDVHFFGLVADWVALALENARLVQQTAEADAQRALDRLRDDLVSIVSHELRTPLATIVGFTELLLTRDLDEPTRRQYLTLVSQEGRRLTDLSNDILDLQRIEGGHEKADLRLAKLRPIVQRALDAAGPDPSRPVEIHVPDDLPFIRTNPDRIHQVLVNLLSNARKYSSPGQPIRVVAVAEPDLIRVSVEDHGLGIPPEALPRLFEKFYRVDTRAHRSIKGTGLGLAICRRIVESYGGRIWAESDGMGKGARFCFTLPHVDAERPADGGEQAREETRVA